MIELVFVIVVIGILAAVALPKLWVTRDDAMIVKARSDVSTIRSAIATDRQKRLMEGNTTIRSALDGATADAEDEALFSDVLDYAIYSKNRTGHWMKKGDNQYVFISPEGNVTFTYYTTTGTFDCNHTNAVCKLLTH